MKIRKIVITGGPCGGKSSALDRIKAVFSEKGYTVLIIAETATELISGGVTPWGCRTTLDYQTGQMKRQRFKERMFEDAARTMDAEQILIVCDRGAMDNRAYMTAENFETLMQELGCTEQSLIDEYDAIFHLVTAAKGAEQFYTTANNAARIETVAEAAALDDRVLEAWARHPHRVVIDNSTDFCEKLDRLTMAIEAFLKRREAEA